MDAAVVIDASYRMLIMVLLLSLPAVITAGVVGLLTAVAQAVTQIQDQGIAQAL
jgi:type III secretion protein S